MSAEALRNIQVDPLALGQPIKFGPGKRAAALRFAYDRELTVEDFLAAASNEVVQHYQPNKKLKQRHHLLARVLAQGVSNEEASIITGYDPQYIAAMKGGDPAFQNLLAFYTEMEAEQYAVSRADMHSRLANLGFDSISELHDRLDESPEKFTNKELLAIVEATSDRTGHGKTSTVNHEHSHSLSAETIARIKGESGSDGAVAENDRQSLLRLAARGTSPELPDAQEGDWIEGEGTLVREDGDPAPAEEVADGAPEVPQVD